MQNGKEKIRETEKRYGAYCFKIAQSVLQNKEDSEECLNDALLQAWNMIPPMKPVHLKLVAIVLDELEECIAGQSDVEAYFEISELQKSISDFVRELPKREGNVFVARYFYVNSVKEIAKKFHLSENNLTSVCVVEEVKKQDEFSDFDEFYEYACKYSVFDREDLHKWYNRGGCKTIKMTYNGAFKKRIVRHDLADSIGLDRNEYWGCMELTDEQFQKIVAIGEVAGLIY